MIGYGYRIVGDCRSERRLIDWRTAFDAYCQCDNRADVNSESYLSAFTFGAAFRQHLNRTGSTKGYNGECFALWLWFDIDRERDIEATTNDARRLCAVLCERFKLDGDELLIFYSGSKGFHVGLSTSLWNPEPSLTFNVVARRFAETIAEQAGVAIDTGVYDKVRAFRSPNSRHRKTGLHKRRLTFDELLNLSTDAIRTLALNGSATLNRQTLDFIRDGAMNGERTNRLFQAAANLGEFRCSLDLADALLTEAGLDSGLPPNEVARIIKCGVEHNG